MYIKAMISIYVTILFSLLPIFPPGERIAYGAEGIDNIAAPAVPAQGLRSEGGNDAAGGAIAASPPSGENSKTAENVKNGETGQREQDIMEEALQLLSESHDYWIRGDVESAIEMLDQAYALILDTDGDPEIARQKDDLRLLISKRILAIYSAMQSTAKGKRGEIPIIMNADVEKEIRSFQTGERDFFIASYQRSGLYRPFIVSELKRLGLPEELSWLPLVESGYKIKALSTARALGLWQFIPSTGYKYGLERDQWVDERMDPEKSTRAAISYLTDLHGMFGDWLTVLAAYNCGEGRVLREISRQRINYLDRFWDLYHQLPYETARYVPRFLATLHIVRDPKKYGMDLGVPMKDQSRGQGYETVKTNKSMRLQDIAVHLNVPEDVLYQLNPELRYMITPDKEYLLKVPPEAVERFAAVAEAIPHWQQLPPAPRSRPVVIVHRVKRGESLGSIAGKYRTTTKAIRSCNHLGAKKNITVGQYLSIPIQVGRAERRDTYRTAEREGKRSGGGESVVRYRVKKGDTLSSVAAKNGTSVAAIKEANRMKGDTLKEGQVLKIVNAARGSVPDSSRGGKAAGKSGQVTKGAKAKKSPAGGGKEKTYTVRKGDSLFRIAKTHDMEISRLRALNNLTGGKDRLREGQVLILE